MNKKKLITIIIIVCLCLLTGFIAFKIIENKSLDNYEYFINYYDDFIPGNEYDIYIFDNYDIKVVKHPMCSTLECINGKKTSDEKFSVKLSENNKKVLKKYVESLFEGMEDNTINIRSTRLSENENKIFKSIIYNDEIFINSYVVEE